MALKNKTHDAQRNAFAQRPAKQLRTVDEHQQASHPAEALERVVTNSHAILRPADVLALQRAVGNRAVQGILTARSRSPQRESVTIQAKLAVGRADDRYEQEADRVAAQVMRFEPAHPSIQRAREDEEGDLQRKPLAVAITPLAQRQASSHYREPPANSLAHDESGDAVTATPAIESAIQHARGGGQPLPDTFRSRMEGAFGADFSNVRVHTDAGADGLNNSLQARAFTSGQNLFFKRGEYNPAVRTGQELIAHELTHVLQQGGGGTKQFPGNSGAWSRISPLVSSGIHSTQAQLQLMSYKVLEKQFIGKDSPVYQKAGYQISITGETKSFDFNEFQISFENNVKDRQAQFFYNETGTSVAKNVQDNTNYTEDVNKKKKGTDEKLLPSYNDLKKTADDHAKAFLKELADAEEELIDKPEADKAEQKVKSDKKRSYALLGDKFTGQKQLAVYKKTGYHLTIEDPNNSFELEEFHVTFENNVNGRQAHFFYDYDGEGVKVVNHQQNLNYKEDASKKHLTPYEELRKKANEHAAAFLKELATAEKAARKKARDDARAKKEAEEKKKKEIKEKIAKAAAEKHTGFTFATKGFHGALEHKTLLKMLHDKFSGSKATGKLGDAKREKTFAPMTKIKFDLQLKDFAAEGEKVYTELFDDARFENVEPAKL